MSSSITDLNTRYASNVERLMAASSRIIQLERVVEAGQALIDVKQAQINALMAITEGTLEILTISRVLFPVDLLVELEPLLQKARETVALVREAP